MNQKEKCFYRDNSILKIVEDRRSLETEQVRAIIFPGMRSGLRKAQERLLKLYKRKRLDRDRVGDTFAYYRDTRPGALQHLLGINWVRLWLEAGLKSWEKMHSFQYEVDFGILRADGWPPSKTP